MYKDRFTETYKGYVAAILAAITFGSSGLFVKLAQNTGLDSLNLLIVQHLVSVPILWVISMIWHKKDIRVHKNTLFRLFVLGALVSSSVNLLYYETFKYLDISIATILFYTYPMILALFSFIFLKQKISRITLLSLFIAFGGCLMVLNLFSGGMILSITGIFYGLGAALVYSIFSILLEKIDKNIPPMVFITYTTSFALLGYLIVQPPMDLVRTGLTGYQLGIAVAIAFVCQVPPNTLLYIAVKNIGALKTSVVSNIEIPSAAIFGYLFFKETLSIFQALGMLLVVAGIMFMKNGDILIANWRERHRDKL